VVTSADSTFGGEVAGERSLAANYRPDSGQSVRGPQLPVGTTTFKTFEVTCRYGSFGSRGDAL